MENERNTENDRYMEDRRNNFGDVDRALEAEYDTFENEGPDEDQYLNASGVEDDALFEPLNVDRNRFDEEFAAEVADPGIELRQDDRSERAEGNPFIGYLSVAMAILSLFVWPVILGPAAVVTGMISYARGSRGLGVTAIVIGIISFLTAMLLFPYS